MDQMIETLAPKLGVQSQHVMRKAAEYARLMEIRSGSSALAALNISGSCKAVMCLELAATSMGQGVDLSTAVRVSGMNKRMYTSGLKATQRILDLESNTSLPELCVQFSCPGAKLLAIQILQKYEEKFVSDSAEVSRSLLNTAALFTACRKEKLRVDKKKLVDIAGVKRPTFDRLISQMEKIADTLKSKKEEKTTKRSKTILDDLQDLENESVQPQKEAKVNTDVEAEEENYDVWKRRILTQAYKALGEEYVDS